MSISIIYFSGYGHTKTVAEHVAKTSKGELIAIDQNGEITQADWDKLSKSKTIVFGTPTYMGGVPWQFKKFADASSKIYAAAGWKDKLFAGFTNSGSLNGDKHSSLQYLHVLASQHGGIWISLALPSASKLSSTREDINNLGGSIGLLVQSPADAGSDKIPSGDLKTAEVFGQRIADLTAKLG